MLSDEVLDKVIERLTNRIEQGNEYVLEQIGNKIKKIGTLKPTQAQQLVQVLKYGGDYEKITKKLAQITKLNVADIHKIFEEVAKNDYQFAEQFYAYRRKKYIPFDENIALKNQVQAIAQLTAKKYVELARSKALGFSVKDDKGNIIFQGLKDAYNDAIDKAILSVSQGKTTFQDEIYRTLKELGNSGVKTLDFEGRTMRLDSAIRMHLKDALRQLHNEVRLTSAKEYGADGVEISVHSFPAPDHEKVQGRQFENNKIDEKKLTEWEKLQSGKTATDYKGVEYTLDHDHKNGYRQISQYNCYHITFPIVLGVSEPLYTDEQLQQIIDDNKKGFEFDGKHYTNYEGTQLQRKLETEIRKNKDIQILARSGNNEKLATESQIKINQLNKKYKELSKVSGLPTYADRLRVSGYNAIKVDKNSVVGRIEKPKGGQSIKPMQDRKPKKQEKWLEYDNLPRWYQEYFNNVIDYDEEGKALVDYLNEKGNADSTASKVFATKIKALGNRDGMNKPTYTHYVEGKGEFERGIYANTLHIPKLTDKQDKTGSVNITLHETWHSIDYLKNNSEYKSSSTYDLKATIRNDDKTIGQPIQDLFKEYNTKSNEVATRVYNENRHLYEELNARWDAREIQYNTYRNYWTKIDNEIKNKRAYENRNLMGGGYDKLQDIYDALSGGSLRDKGIVRYGHGSKYYKEVNARAEEIFADYCTLSMTRPDLVELLKEDKPELVEELENILRSMLDD